MNINMGFPPFLIGLGIPLLVGLLGIGLYMYNQERFQHQQHQQYQYGRPRRISFSDDSEVCPICLDSMNPRDSSPLNCGHKIHDVCLVELNKRQQNKCPQCRADITY